MDPTLGWKETLAADLQFLLFKQVNQAHGALVWAFGLPSFPPTAAPSIFTAAVSCATSTTLSPCQAKPVHSPTGAQSPVSPPGQRHPAPHPQPVQQENDRKQKTRRNRDDYYYILFFFTSSSVVPRCPSPCPSRAYPRTSLLFQANQTEPGYTLTHLPSGDKAAWVLADPCSQLSPWPLTCSTGRDSSAPLLRAGVTARPSP